MNNILAIIPARGGSKRIPRKNIKPFLGKPMIEYAIQALLQESRFTEVMVSTDDQEIVSIARAAGANIPFLRSEKNSNDFAGTFEVLEEVIHAYRSIGKVFEYVCCCYPTAPLLSRQTLKTALDLVQNENADGAFTVVKFSYPVQRALRINPKGVIEMCWPENYSKRSQDLEPIYHDAGQFYLLRTKNLLEEKSLYLKKSKPIILSDLQAQDIDSVEDWEIAQLKYQLLKSRGEL